MSNVNGLLVLDRVSYFRELLKCHRGRQPSLGLSNDSIALNYRGVEGVHWPQVEHKITFPIYGGLAPVEYFGQVFEYFNMTLKYRLSDLIYITDSTSTSLSLPLPVGLCYCGYDYALFYSVFNCYSALVNEVIYGEYDDLRIYANSLNSYLLLPEAKDADLLERERMRLLHSGFDLESSGADEVFRTFSIYGLSDRGQ